MINETWYKTLAAKRSYLGCVAVEGSVDSGKRWRVAPCDECRAAPAQKIRRGLSGGQAAAQGVFAMSQQAARRQPVQS